MWLWVWGGRVLYWVGLGKNFCGWGLRGLGLVGGCPGGFLGLGNRELDGGFGGNFCG
jgi:hypothetical protein